MTQLRTARMPGADEARRDSPCRAERGSLHRLNVNVTPLCASELERLAELTGYSKTDVVNRAISVYNFLEETLRSGGEIRIRRGPDDDHERLTFL